MHEITSLQNHIIKEITALHQKKHRAETGLFIIEGKKGVEEALKDGLEIKYIFLSTSVIDRRAKSDAAIYLKAFPQDKLFSIDEKIMKKISTTETAPEILAVSNQVKFSLQDLFKENNPLIIVLEHIKDAGNMGTIIRTAKAANASGIILAGDCIDSYNPKVVRSSAANLWKIPVISFKDTANLRKTLEKHKPCQFLATKIADNHKQSLYNDADYKKPTVLMFGSEADGISEELASQADLFIKIPMNDEVESLNLSVSAGIIMYEAYRQKNKGGK